MVDTWTEADEQKVLAMLARKAKLLNPDRQALVKALDEKSTLFDDADRTAELLIARAGEFRKLLEPFESPTQGTLPIEPEWIEWSGGTQPVHDRVKVEVKFRGSTPGKTEARSVGEAETFLWSHAEFYGTADIVAYRVVT